MCRVSSALQGGASTSGRHASVHTATIAYALQRLNKRQRHPQPLIPAAVANSEPETPSRRRVSSDILPVTDASVVDGSDPAPRQSLRNYEVPLWGESYRESGKIIPALRHLSGCPPNRAPSCAVLAARFELDSKCCRCFLLSSCHTHIAFVDVCVA